MVEAGEKVRVIITDEEREHLLSRKIKDLPLKIEGTYLENLIDRLYRELRNSGISFRPETYLSDDWGCPSGVPVIGIPFYLADPRLSALEFEMTGVEAEDPDETMMFLRHEAGHAFNYAYRLYKKAYWREVFGRYSLPYREDYRPVPFSTRFVRHLPGWYAQKHPDDDFAETFAVWLNPESCWRTTYAGTPAMSKLLYVDYVARELGNKPPVVADGWRDLPLSQLNLTLEAWYRRCRYACDRFELPEILNEDLKALFPFKEGIPAFNVLQEERARLLQKINAYTGVNRHILTAFIKELLERIRALELKISPGRIQEQVIEAAIFFTVLAMNYICRGRFCE